MCVFPLPFHSRLEPVSVRFILGFLADWGFPILVSVVAAAATLTTLTLATFLPLTLSPRPPDGMTRQIEHLRQLAHYHVCILEREAVAWTEPDHVPKSPGDLDDDLTLKHLLPDERGQDGVGLSFRSRPLDEVDANGETLTANLADEIVYVRETFDLGVEVVSNFADVLVQASVFQLI